MHRFRLIGVLVILPNLSFSAPQDLTIYITGGQSPKQQAAPDSQRTDSLYSSQYSQFDSNRIEDIGDYVPGVTVGRTQAGISNNLVIRGFSSEENMFLDGLPDHQGYFIRDPYTLESIEISKGMNTTRFGSGAPGGSVNSTSKKPQQTPHRRVNLKTGTPEHYRLESDLNIAQSESDWQARFVSIFQKAETGQVNVGDDRYTFFPSLRHRSEQHDFVIELEATRQNREYDFDHVFVKGKPLYDVSYVDPRTEAQRDSLRLTTHYQQLLNESWSFHVSASHIDMDRYDRLVGFYYLASEDAPLPGYYRTVNENYEQSSARLELKHDVAGQQTKAGLSVLDKDSDIDSAACRNCFQLDIYNPVFDYPLPADSDMSPNDYRTRSTVKAAYIEHEHRFGDVQIQAGTRYSAFNTDFNHNDEGAEKTSDDAAATYSLGSIWNMAPRWQLFANYNESFQPNRGTDRHHNFFKPLEGVNKELGLRYKSEVAKLQVSTYRITQDNILNRDPEDRSYKINAGSIRSRGLELNASFPVNSQVDLSTYYAYNDAHITRSTQGLEGNRLHSSARHSGSVKLNYRPNERAKLILGMVRVGKRPGDDANSFEIPAYTRWDVSTSYQFNKDINFTLSVRNLLDEDYVATSSANDFVVQGRKRTVTAGVGFDW